MTNLILQFLDGNFLKKRNENLKVHLTFGCWKVKRNWVPNLIQFPG
jgi:hypothetical protein